MSSSFSSSRTLAWTVWIIASIFYAYQYVLRVMPSIFLSDITEQFEIGAVAFGQFSGIYYIGYSLLHLPLGILLDRYGPRKVIAGSILLAVAGLSPLLFAEQWIYPIGGRFLIGLGSSAAILGVFKIVRMAFHEKHFSRMLSLSVTIGLVGAIYGGGPLNAMRESLGYQTSIFFLAAAGVLLAAVTYWIVPDLKSPSQTGVFSNIKEVLRNRQVIGSCLFAGLMVGPLEGFADVWGSAFLQQVYGFEGTLAASLPSLIFIGMCFGAPFLGLLAEKIGSHLGAIIGAGLVMGVSFSFLLTSSFTPTLLSFCFVLIGACSAYQILAIYLASTYVREEVAGLTTAVANMIIMFFGYAFHTVIGTIVNALGGADVSQALLYGVGVIPVALFVGAIGFILLWFQEKNKKQVSYPFTGA